LIDCFIYISYVDALATLLHNHANKANLKLKIEGYTQILSHTSVIIVSYERHISSIMDLAALTL